MIKEALEKKTEHELLQIKGTLRTFLTEVERELARRKRKRKREEKRHEVRHE